MPFGICTLSIVPLRAEPSDKSEIVSQILYGELFEIIESNKKWSQVKLAFDNYEGWIDTKQYIEISQKDFQTYSVAEGKYVTDLVEYVDCEKQHIYPITLGASIHTLPLLGHTFDGHFTSGEQSKENLLKTAFLYLNTPYLWGGKSPFGIDCSGLTQMVYKLNGYKLQRDASQQANQGEALSFIEESEPGDLAFFDNEEGDIIHVGIIMKDNHIIHAHGKVRIDRLDHSGIYNIEKNAHTHKLRVIKKII
ncbi:MAG: C40 family peptidase [Flavobacteriaceae bacterium]|nr:C40 family peptidase [Flavobacteriaceae bacterium]